VQIGDTGSIVGFSGTTLEVSDCQVAAGYVLHVGDAAGEHLTATLVGGGVHNWILDSHAIERYFSHHRMWHGAAVAPLQSSQANA
jgi:hypothetical protein